MEPFSRTNGTQMTRTAPTTPVSAPDVLYHGTNRLFAAFDMDHALEGDGKVKFGWGVYVTDRVDSALKYARTSQKRHPGSGCFVYKAEVPALAPGNHIAFGEPVAPAIAACVGKELGAEIPAAALADGKLFRKFVACRLEGSKKKTPTLAGEKAAAELLDRLGVVCISWPFNWAKDAEGRFLPPFNRAVFDAAKVRIVSVDRYDEAGNVVETIPADKLPK